MRATMLIGQIEEWVSPFLLVLEGRLTEMDLAYAVLAKAADVMPDGKLYLFAADDYIRSSGTFPLNISPLVVVLKINFPYEECNRTYQVRVDFVTPDGQVVLEGGGMTLSPSPAPLDLDRIVGVVCVFNFTGLTFNSEGTYYARIRLDDKELKKLRIFALAESAPRPQGD